MSGNARLESEVYTICVLSAVFDRSSSATRHLTSQYIWCENERLSAMSLKNTYTYSTNSHLTFQTPPCFEPCVILY